MDLVLLLVRVVLAGVFLVASLAKLADRRGSVQAMRNFGVPARLAAPAGVALPIVEMAVALALLPTASVRWGALGALTLLLTFVAGIAVNLARGKAPDCHCFGQLHSEPAGWPTLARNSILSAIAAFLLVAGWDNPGPSTVAWLGDLSTAEAVLLAGNVLALALIAVEGWALVHLLQQNGRLLLRLDALESTVHGGATKTSHAGTLSGLRVGTPAPDFALSSLAGQTTTLVDLRHPGIPTMLVFSDPGCGPCNTLMPEIAQWQQEHAGTLAIALVSRGGLEANRSKAGELGIRNVVVQQDREVAEAYEVQGTPSAVLIRPDGAVGSAVAAGADAIRGLVTTITTAKPPTVPLRAANGTTHHPASPSLVGKAAPDATLSTLDGNDVTLASVIAGEPTVLLFWNPGCGFCNRMLDELKVLEANPQPGAPNLVVISAGDVERNRAQGIQSTVVLDQGFSAGRQFGATGTPSAVLIDSEGIVASDVIVGAPAVLALAGGKTEIRSAGGI